MGDGDNAPLKLTFDSTLRLEFHNATITSDVGLLTCRELDEALRLTETASDYVYEGRTVQNQLLSLLRQSVCSRL